MAAKIRVHELAKELGLTNKECLDLCLALGIGVKTHSSGIEEAQADRVRRRAERDGLVRPEQPEPAGAKKGGKRKPAAAAPATAASDERPSGSTEGGTSRAERPATAERPPEGDGSTAEAPDAGEQATRPAAARRAPDTAPGEGTPAPAKPAAGG
ncbi:MAG: translation initiation factor IF-2 N-terminal domain-containing protein, partial [Acidimicrobiia bacterium]